MNANFAENVRGQGALNRYTHGLVITRDHTKRLRRAYEEMSRIKSSAAVAVGVRKSRAANGACGNPDQVGLTGCRIHGSAALMC
jgi:hypothetical protein